MKRVTAIAAALFVAALVALTINVSAQDFNPQEKTYLTFSAPVQLTAAALTLGRTNGAALTGVNLVLSNPSGDGQTYVVRFSGSGVIGGSLPDGKYTLSLSRSAIKAASDGQALTGTSTFTFLRLFGDSNGDGGVTTLDYSAFRQAYGTKTGDPAYSMMFDYNADGGITTYDYSMFIQRYGTSAS